MANGNGHRTYEFDEFRLDAEKLMLYRSGHEILLPPKVIKTLAVLIEDSGEILSKDELLEKVWEGSIVEESNLSQYLYLLRKTLGEKSDGKPYIETLRRRGYRFTGDAHLVEHPAASATSAAPQYEIERQGNVLKLADWSKSAENFSSVTKAAGASTSLQRLVKLITAIAVAAVLIPAAIFWFRSGENGERAEKHGDLTVLPLTNGVTISDATISPDGKYFVYHEQEGRNAHLWLQQTGQANRVEIIPPSPRIISGKTFSPDSQFIYFLSEDGPDAQADLYRVPTLGGVQTKLLSDIGSPVSFSPDGREMVFRRRNAQAKQDSVIIAESDGSNERTLLTHPGDNSILGTPAWSPDGKSIAFGVTVIEHSFFGNCSIMSVDAQTGTVFTSLSNEKWDTCYRMVWTHDGQGLVFVGTKAGEGYSTRRDEIYYVSSKTGESRRLTTDGNRYQLWSLGITDRDEIIAVPYSRSSQIWVTSADGDWRNAIQLTRGQADGRAGLAPLYDGRVGYITRSGDDLNIWIMNGDGTDQKQLTSDPPVVEELRAVPNEQRFVFSNLGSDHHSHLFVIGANGENLRQLTFGDSDASDSTVSPDGKWVVYSSVLATPNFKHTLWKIPTEGGEPTQLNETVCETPHFSPDGRLVSCIHSENQIAIISMDDGSVAKTFETDPLPILNSGARWTPDGRNLVYIVIRDKITNLVLQPIDGSATRPLTDFKSGSIYNFAFSTDGARLYLARGYDIHDAVIIRNFR
jgi:Tol biopolymer transport system component/DNA-binding winged helix-turn-helix (wHTH) protein